jgi:uncharacterized protein (TIGR01777 family)
MKNMLITGGTGFIGQELRTLLLQEGHNITVVTRNPKKYEDESAKNQRFVSWDSDLAEVMNTVDVVIHLAGENLFSGRWTEEIKDRIYSSRINTTKALVDAMKKAESKPKLFISASASGIYGNRGEEILDEAESVGDDFLAKVCIDWETEAQIAVEFGVRVANPRIGIVLEKDGGALQKMIPPFQMFVGGPVGDGTQYMSWIHREDLLKALIAPIDYEQISGPYNVCAPTPVTMNMFARALGNAMNRPVLFRVPEFALKIAFGEGSKPILDSIRMKPGVLQEQAFDFRYDDLDEAIVDILYD